VRIHDGDPLPEPLMSVTSVPNFVSTIVEMVDGRIENVDEREEDRLA